MPPEATPGLNCRYHLCLSSRKLSRPSYQSLAWFCPCWRRWTRSSRWSLSDSGRWYRTSLWLFLRSCLGGSRRDSCGTRANWCGRLHCYPFAWTVSIDPLRFLCLRSYDWCMPWLLPGNCSSDKISWESWNFYYPTISCFPAHSLVWSMDAIVPDELLVFFED